MVTFMLNLEEFEGRWLLALLEAVRKAGAEDAAITFVFDDKDDAAVRDIVDRLKRYLRT